MLLRQWLLGCTLVGLVSFPLEVFAKPPDLPAAFRVRCREANEAAPEGDCRIVPAPLSGQVVGRRQEHRVRHFNTWDGIRNDLREESNDACPPAKTLFRTPQREEPVESRPSE